MSIRLRGPLFVQVDLPLNIWFWREDCLTCCDGSAHEMVGRDKITDDPATSGARCNICGRFAVNVDFDNPKRFFTDEEVLIVNVFTAMDREMGRDVEETFFYSQSECPSSPDGNHVLADVPHDWFRDNRIFRPRGSDGAHCIYCGKTAKTYWDIFAEKNIGDKPIPVRGRSEEEVREMVKTGIFSGMEFDSVDTECVIPGRPHQFTNSHVDWRNTGDMSGVHCLICKRPAILEQ